jgi:hypothetical protein
MEVVNVFENAGYTWGGRFNSIKDNPHLEKTFGNHWKTLLKKYQDKRFIPNTSYVQL